jgi:hypothetical protein
MADSAVDNGLDKTNVGRALVTAAVSTDGGKDEAREHPRGARSAARLNPSGGRMVALCGSWLATAIRSHAKVTWLEESS